VVAPWPNLFLVGAPRCGTTSLFTYLAGHPDVFGPVEKEPHYYDRDVLGPGGMEEDDYAALFAGATSERWRLDASTLYLYSASAPAAIKRDSPEAHVLVALRDPVEFVASWHNLLVASGSETIVDLGAALDAEADRREGRRVPPNGNAALLLYSELARFEEHVDRWRAVFGDDRVHLIVLEDLQARPEETSASLLRELDLARLDEGAFPHLNPARRTGAAVLLAPLNRDSALRSVVRRVLPASVRRYAWHRLTRSLTPPGDRPPIEPVVRLRLERLLAGEIEFLARVRTPASA
jgi:hypothetical protein